MNTALFSGSDLDVVFFLVLTMSLSASWIAAAVLVLRLCLKRAPKWVNVLLWGIVAARLVLPVSIESPLSLLPRTEAILPAVTAQPIQTGTAPAVGSAAAIASGAAMRSQPGWTTILAWVWLVGIAVLLLYTWISTQRLRRNVREAVRLQGNIYETEHIDSPFVLGVLRPRIYLPYHMDSRDREQVIAHEQAHLRRGDHVWKPLGFLLLTIVRMVIATRGVGLPDLQQHITDRCSGAVDNPAFNGDPLPGGIRGGEDRAKVFLKNMKARGVRRQTDMNIGSRRLRGGFRQILFHRAAP